jgi:hypothetical protein
MLVFSHLLLCISFLSVPRCCLSLSLQRPASPVLTARMKEDEQSRIAKRCCSTNCARHMMDAGRGLTALLVSGACCRPRVWGTNRKGKLLSPYLLYSPQFSQKRVA